VDECKPLGGGGSGAAAVEAELAKLAAWPEPSSGAKLHRFMSVAKKYSHWVPDYPRLAAPLTELLHVRWAGAYTRPLLSST